MKHISHLVIDSKLIQMDKKKRAVTPLIDVKLKITYRLETLGIYDSGSNVASTKTK